MALLKQNDAFKKMSGIKQQPINNSSFLQNFRYDADNNQLVVTFKNGGEYIYNDVDAALIEMFNRAPSKGGFYAQYIKGKFSSTRIINKTSGPQEGQHGTKRVEGQYRRRSTVGRAERGSKSTRGY